MSESDVGDVEVEDLAPTFLSGMILVPEEWRLRCSGEAAHCIASIVVAVQIAAYRPRLRYATRSQRRQIPCTKKQVTDMIKI